MACDYIVSPRHDGTIWGARARGTGRAGAAREEEEEEEETHSTHPLPNANS